MDSTQFDLSAARKAARQVLRKENHKQDSVNQMAAKAARDAKFVISEGKEGEPEKSWPAHMQAAYVAGIADIKKVEKPVSSLA